MRVSELKVAALAHVVSAEGVTGMWLCDGERTTFEVGSLAELVPRVDAVRDELRNAMAVARARVPRLLEFTQEWGRRLVPEALLAGEADVVVVIPHSLLHGLPLHAVTDEGGVPLGATSGFTYASSATLFARCAERNAARRLDSATWTFDGGDGAQASGHYEPGEYRGGGIDVIADDPGFKAMVAEVARVLGADWRDWEFPFTRVAVKGPLWSGKAGDVQCIAAHGIVDAQDHRFSGLLLARDPGVGGRTVLVRGTPVVFFDRAFKGPPGRLKLAHEAEILTIAEMQIEGAASVQMLALLGCSAGWSRMLSGDEPASIAQSFLQLGIPTVAAPLWDSHVDATREWAQTFFGAWASGMPKALAAREALRRLVADGLGPERHSCLALRGDWL